MKKILSVFLLILCYNVCYSQWINQLNIANCSAVNSIIFSDTLNGIITGYKLPEDRGRILYTHNGGNNWNFALLPDSTNSIIDSQFITENIFYACGNSHTNILSTDANPMENKEFLLPDGYSREKSGAGFKALFMKSTDNGEIWKSVGTIPSNVNYLWSISFLNPEYGFASCDVGVQSTNAGMLKTIDGGNNWELLNIPNDIYRLKTVLVKDSLNIIAVGTKFTNIPPYQYFTGVMLKSSDAGNSWIQELFPDVNGFNSIYFANNLTGFAVGNGNRTDLYAMKGSIYKTTNGSASWFPINISFSDTSFLNCVKFLPNGTGIIQGNKYKITETEIRSEYLYVVKSTDFGSTWVMSKVVTGNYVGTKIEIITDQKFYLAGYSHNSFANVFYTPTGGSTFINTNSGQIPSTFSLFQNYPNPFNPTTRINYELQITNYVTLNVYDINGRLVKELVNKKQSAGNYSINFDGSGLPSGTYVYRLQAGDFSETRKMVLLK